MENFRPKDYFSSHASLYATFRPSYPEDLYRFIFNYVKNKSVAWDCATGNGQVAAYLANHFDKVYATDISQQQLENAHVSDNIYYSVNPAEKTSFADNQFDLITVAQALHWFDREKFYDEVKRTGKPGCMVAVWGYNFISISPEIDELVLDFYHNVVGSYWDNARKLVEDSYKSISFPFEEIETPEFSIPLTWSLDQLSGYLTTWSATQKYIREHDINPVEALVEKLKPYWHDGILKPIRFPVFLRLGRVNK